MRQNVRGRSNTIHPLNVKIKTFYMNLSFSLGRHRYALLFSESFNYDYISALSLFPHLGLLLIIDMYSITLSNPFLSSRPDAHTRSTFTLNLFGSCSFNTRVYKNSAVSNSPFGPRVLTIATGYIDTQITALGILFGYIGYYLSLEMAWKIYRSFPTANR